MASAGAIPAAQLARREPHGLHASAAKNSGKKKQVVRITSKPACSHSRRAVARV